MKQSKYNFLYKIDDRYFIFNSLSRGLAELEEGLFEKLFNNEIEQIKPEDFEALKAENYIIDNNLDEVALIKENYKKRRNDTSFLSYVIAPTLNCNFRCPYCFQEHVQRNMDKETADKLYKHIINSLKKHKSNKLVITWYGGEPLLKMDIIEYLSEKLIKYTEDNDIKYLSNIITNGYLLSKDFIKRLIKNKVSSAQITIDGPKYVHDKRRVLAHGKGTYDKIIDNIKEAIKSDIDVNIRINVDRSNAKNASELVNDLADEGIKKIRFTLGYVKDFTDICQKVKDTKLLDKDFRNYQYKFNDKLKSHEYKNQDILDLPTKGINCGAVSSHTVVVDPEGYLYKCWNDVGVIEKAFGSISDLKEETVYKNYSPFENTECYLCKGLPICLGSCPFETINKGRLDCISFEDMIENYIKNQIY